MNRICLHLLSISFLISCARAEASQIVISNNSDYQINVGKEFQILEDRECNMTYEQVLSSLDFKQSLQLVPNLNVSKSAFWIKMEVNNQSDFDYLVLDVAQPSLDEVSLFCFNQGKLQIQKLNDRIPIENRWIRNQNYCFKLDLMPMESRVFYLRVASGDQIQIPTRIGSFQAIISEHAKKDFWFGSYCGVFLCIILMNLFVYFRTLERNYLEYVIYIVVLLLTQCNFQGYTLRFVWPFAPNFERYAVFFLSTIVGIIGIRFISRYINSTDKVPSSKNVFNVCFIFYAVVLLFAILGYHQLAYKILQPAAGFAAISVLIITALVYKRGSKTAGNVLMAWSVFLIGIVIFVLKDFEIVPFNGLTYNIMTIGSLLEGILLSFGLADRINVLKREKELAQLRELEALKVNSAELEILVHDRTAELEKSKEDLQSNYNNLVLTQKKLVESEKLAGLGVMSAGIAHELNNPLNFVTSNIDPLRRDVNQVISFMDEFENIPQEVAHPSISALRERYKTDDMHYVKYEIEQLLRGIGEGAKRSAEIVKGLRIFARTDNDTPVRANINECLEATLMLMKSNYKDQVVLSKNLDAFLPEIECFAGKLNQVFVNLINNAVQSYKGLDTKKTDKTVMIKSWYDDNNIFISVTDHGKGIEQELHAKIFEPFFTTKGVGEGTGLGLSISKSIVDDHKGKITMTTIMGKGTTFLLEIPRKWTNTNKLAA